MISRVQWWFNFFLTFIVSKSLIRKQLRLKENRKEFKKEICKQTEPISTALLTIASPFNTGYFKFTKKKKQATSTYKVYNNTNIEHIFRYI